MRIAFVHDWPPDLYQEMTWKDGLAAAVKILSQRHDLRFWTLGETACVLPHPYFPIHVVPHTDALVAEVRAYEPDVILHWGDLTRPNARPLLDLGVPQALCFAGGDTDGRNQDCFEHFFVESEVYRQRFEVSGCSVSTAFGTNTELFQPIPLMAKQFDVIFPATYCDWKRHTLFTEATRGLKAITSGFMYPVAERYCWEDTMKAGVLTLPHVGAETLQHLFAASKVCLITSRASGGSQRTVLEAMAMNIPVVVMEDSDKTREYVMDAQKLGFNVGGVAHKAQDDNWATGARNWIDAILGNDKDWNGRDYIMSKWSEHHYADAIERGLQQIV
jgi:glycosyltransferase involved in cell wall biosynthesis